MTAMNAKYTKTSFAPIFSNAVNYRTLTAFYASAQNKFPTDITRLTSQLTRIYDQKKEHTRLLTDLASRVVLNN